MVYLTSNEKYKNLIFLLQKHFFKSYFIGMTQAFILLYEKIKANSLFYFKLTQDLKSIRSSKQT